MAEMTYFRSPRLWLLSTVALLFGSQISASAQIAPNYHAGVPTMVAAAPSLPTIPAEQIARDVIAEFNPRTGTQELIAAPFDPFEEDPTLAASLRLRSADGAVAIDGYPLRDGALVEIDFYYNSPSDDPYGGRNYGEAAFVNGDLAPVVKRDTRIIECSTRVENVIYDHASFYGGGYSAGLYRPYRHYAGHSAFGFGFGSSYFGPGYSFFDGSLINFNLNSFGGRSFVPTRSFGSRSFGSRSFGSRSIPNRRNVRRSRIVNSDRDREEGRRTRDRDRENARRARRNLNSERAENRDRETRRVRRNTRRATNREDVRQDQNVQNFDNRRTQNGIRRNTRPSRIGSPVNARPQFEASPSSSQSSSARSSAAPSSAAQSPQSQSSRNRPARGTQTRRNDTQRSSTRRASSERRESRRNETRSRSSNSSRSNSRSTSRTNRRSNSSSKSRQSRRTSANENRRKLNFFPNAGHGGRSVVTSHAVDCAREDKMTVFIPNERLDAARFDGLTLIALDAQGGEAPIYLPPNYIEGFRLAATGQVRPQRVSPGARPNSHPNASPGFRSGVEPAPCPAGTSKQPDGTCLQSGEFGYPR